jgi:predicted ATP-grasp superfamily ATP-dependent carboligase
MGVLVTNGDGHIALSVIRSLGRKGLQITSGSEWENILSSHSRYNCHSFTYPSPLSDENGFIDRLVEMVEGGEFEVIFPADWDTLLPISKHRKKLEPHTLVPMPSHDVIERINNKAEVMRIAQKAGIPCPKTFFELTPENAEEIQNELSYPLVVKPHIGAGSDGLSIVNNPDQLESEYRKCLEKYGPTLIQEYIHGTPYIFSGLFNRDSEARRVCVQKKIREYPITGGPTCAGETVWRDDLLEYSIRLFKAFGYFGFASTDHIVDKRDNLPKVLEINPRFFGSIAIPIAAGVDYPYDFYRILMDGDIETKLEYKIGVMGRELLIDGRHMMSVLRGASSPKYKIGKMKTLLNFMKFYKYKTDFVLSLNDPGPGLYDLKNLLRRMFAIH